MRSRPTLAAGALLATAAMTAAGLTGGAAHAAYHHGSVARHSAARGVVPVTPDLTVTSTKTSVTLSAATITPGNTTIAIGGQGSIEVVSLKSGYSLTQVFKDAAHLFGPNNVKYVRKIDKKVVFWGGMGGSNKTEVAMNLPAGTYYVINIDAKKPVYATLTVAGTPSTRVLPASTGAIKMVQDMTMKAPNSLTNQGWITIDNQATEPHFVDLTKVKKGTTKATVREFLMSGAQGQPKWATNIDYDVLIASPGHSFSYYLTAPKGEYVALCFWPSKKTGLPHALMGMFDITQLG